MSEPSLSIAPADPLEPYELAASAARALRRRDTSHLKLTPGTTEERERIRARAEEVAAQFDLTYPVGRDVLETAARAILAELEATEGYVGWTMVALVTAFWRDQVAAIPMSRRLLLLPRCIQHPDTDASRCGVAELRTVGEALGYKTLAPNSSQEALKMIVRGYADAVVGVASLDILERAIDKVLPAGVPCLAAPLEPGDCRQTLLERDWIHQLIAASSEPRPARTRTYIHLMRGAARMFELPQLERLAPRQRAGATLANLNGHAVKGLDPIAGTEAIAYDFLAKGGKHSRPFITLAVHDALTGGRATMAGGAQVFENLPKPIQRAALSIETFHKASLVHDDIEDDDAFRYGDATLHRKHGAPTAINIGDYLIGLGYRLVSREARSLGPEVAADILDRLADAHMKLSEGQGAELLWRDAHDKRLRVADALKIYALKTSPAFEAALVMGLRLAGPVDEYAEPMSQFSRNLGVAFQILNDLGDWREDSHNKLTAGGDVLGGRPTVLWALALEALAEPDRKRLEQLAAERPATAATVEGVRQLYQAAGVFDKAERLVETHQRRAEEIAAAIEPDALRRLLEYLILNVLERPPLDPASASEPKLSTTPNIATPKLATTKSPAK